MSLQDSIHITRRTVAVLDDKGDEVGTNTTYSASLSYQVAGMSRDLTVNDAALDQLAEALFSWAQAIADSDVKDNVKPAVDAEVSTKEVTV